MIFWFGLFILVVLISFLLALRSMRDYSESPKGLEYGLYLIRNTQNLTHQTLDKLYEQLKQAGLTISLERLIKGNQSALVVFGPQKILASLVSELNLLELEDYTSLEVDNVTIWEISLKGVLFNIRDLLVNLKLEPTEQFWWQVLIQPSKDKNTKLFQSQIRAAAISLTQPRRKQILEQFLKTEHISKFPKPFSNEQFYNFLRDRTLVFDKSNPRLKSDEVLRLVK